MSSDNYIRKQFQEKFNDFKGEVSPDGWKRLEAALDEAAFVALTPRRRWHYAVASAAAVLLLIVGSVLFIKRPWEQIELLVAETVVTDTVADEPVESKAESLLVTGTVVLEGSEASVKPGRRFGNNPGRSFKRGYPCLPSYRGH
jgi:hypothetical protein